MCAWACVVRYACFVGWTLTFICACACRTLPLFLLLALVWTCVRGSFTRLLLWNYRIANFNNYTLPIYLVSSLYCVLQLRHSDATSSLVTSLRNERFLCLFIWSQCLLVSYYGHYLFCHASFSYFGCATVCHWRHARADASVAIVADDRLLYCHVFNVFWYELSWQHIHILTQTQMHVHA